MHDLIGDLHGHADALERLLATLGYTRQHGIYRHPDRRDIFLGDFIDRGPHIRETLEIVRPMIDSGAALSMNACVPGLWLPPVAADCRTHGLLSFA